jgi:hypothetical protein
MTEDSPTAAGERGGHPSTVPRDPWVAYGVHAAVNSMQPARFHATNHAAAAQAGFFQLPQGRDTVLSIGNPRDQLICPGAFVPHTETKSPEHSCLPLGSGALAHRSR